MPKPEYYDEQDSSDEWEHDLTQDEYDEDEYDEEEEHDPRPYFPNPFKILFAVIKKGGGLVKFSCLALVILLLLAVVTIVFRPPVLWNPVKVYLNEGIEREEVIAIAPSGLRAQILDELRINGRTAISEEELAILMQDKLNTGRDLRVMYLENKVMRVLANIEAEGEPLWFEVSLKQEEGKLGIEKLGLVRVGFPELITNIVSDRAGAVLDFVKRENFADLFEDILDIGEDGEMQIVTVEIQDDQAIVEINE